MKTVTKINIKQIAQMAGVSVATVSRVVNNPDCVKSETREKVLQVIEEYDYIPNAAARDLSTNRSNVIGVIFPDLTNPFFLALLNGITQVAESNQYNVLVFNSDEDAEKERSIMTAAGGRNLAGIIVTPTNDDDVFVSETLQRYQKSGMAVVLLDRDVRGAEFSSVMSENEEASYEAACCLADAGHTKIAFIEGDTNKRPVWERSRGFFRAMKDRHITVPEAYVIKCDQRWDKVYRRMGNIMNLPDPPTAVFTSNSMMTLGCLKYFTEHHIEIGKDIALIGFDDIETLRMINYHLSVVDRSETEMGARAMEMLLRQMRGISKKVERECVPTKLILRGSEKFTC